MAFQRRLAGNRNQLIDWIDIGFTISPAATPFNSPLIGVGTVFPLLANTGARVFNVGAQLWASDTSLQISCTSIALFWGLFSDAEGQNQLLDANGEQVVLLVASQGYSGLGLKLGTYVGATCQADGDPLTEIRANLLVAGVSGVPAAMQLIVEADVNSSDTVSSHDVVLTASALLDFQV